MPSRGDLMLQVLKVLSHSQVRRTGLKKIRVLAELQGWDANVTQEAMEDISLHLVSSGLMTTNDDGTWNITSAGLSAAKGKPDEVRRTADGFYRVPKATRLPSSRSAIRDTPEPAFCPKHFTQLPANGICDDCQ